MKLMVTVPEPSDAEVSVFAGFTELSTTSQVSPFWGSPTVWPSAPQPNDPVELTGVKLGRAELGSPPSGASMIHSTLLPLNVAPGGGWMIRLKCCPVVLLAKLIWTAVWLLMYWTEQKIVSPGLTGKLGMFVWKMYGGVVKPDKSTSEPLRLSLPSPFQPMNSWPLCAASTGASELVSGEVSLAPKLWPASAG